MAMVLVTFGHSCSGLTDLVPWTLSTDHILYSEFYIPHKKNLIASHALNVDTYADFSVGDSPVASPQNREGAYIYRFSHDFVKTETYHISMTQHKKCSY